MAGPGPNPGATDQTRPASAPGRDVVPPGLRVRGGPEPSQPARPPEPEPTRWTGFEPDRGGAAKKTGLAAVALLALAAAIVAAVWFGLMPARDRQDRAVGPAGEETATLIASAAPGDVLLVLSEGPAGTPALKQSGWPPADEVQLPVTPANAAAWRAALVCAPPHGLIVLPEGKQPDPLDRLVADRAFRDWFDTHYARNASRHVRLFRTRLVNPPQGQCGPPALRPRQTGPEPGR
jgi:predicted outer membrane lipoprotein